jgi:hypothetical protein
LTQIAFRANDRLLGSARVKLRAAVHAHPAAIHRHRVVKNLAACSCGSSPRLVDGIIVNIVAVVIVLILDALTNI